MQRLLKRGTTRLTSWRGAPAASLPASSSRKSRAPPGDTARPEEFTIKLRKMKQVGGRCGELGTGKWQQEDGFRGDVLLALTHGHHLAASSSEWLRRGPCLRRAHQHPSLLPRAAPRDPVFPCRHCLRQLFHLLRAFQWALCSFPWPQILLAPRPPPPPRAAAGAAQSPWPRGAHTLSSHHTKGDAPRGKLSTHLPNMVSGQAQPCSHSYGACREGGQSWCPSFLARVPSAAHVVPGPAALGGAGEAPMSDG